MLAVPSNRSISGTPNLTIKWDRATWRLRNNEAVYWGQVRRPHSQVHVALLVLTFRVHLLTGMHRKSLEAAEQLKSAMSSLSSSPKHKSSPSHTHHQHQHHGGSFLHHHTQVPNTRYIDNTSSRSSSPVADDDLDDDDDSAGSSSSHTDNEGPDDHDQKTRSNHTNNPAHAARFSKSQSLVPQQLQTVSTQAHDNSLSSDSEVENNNSRVGPCVHGAPSSGTPTPSTTTKSKRKGPVVGRRVRIGKPTPSRNPDDHQLLMLPSHQHGGGSSPPSCGGAVISAPVRLNQPNPPPPPPPLLLSNQNNVCMVRYGNPGIRNPSATDDSSSLAHPDALVADSMNVLGSVTPYDPPSTHPHASAHEDLYYQRRVSIATLRAKAVEHLNEIHKERGFGGPAGLFSSPTTTNPAGGSASSDGISVSTHQQQQHPNTLIC